MHMHVMVFQVYRTLSRHRPLTIAVGKCLATLRTAIRICLVRRINKEHQRRKYV